MAIVILSHSHLRMFRNTAVAVYIFNTNMGGFDMSRLSNVKSLTITSCTDVGDLNPLSTVGNLTISHCHDITDVSSLCTVNNLNIDNCKHLKSTVVYDIRKVVHNRTFMDVLAQIDSRPPKVVGDWDIGGIHFREALESVCQL